MKSVPEPNKWLSAVNHLNYSTRLSRAERSCFVQKTSFTHLMTLIMSCATSHCMRWLARRFILTRAINQLRNYQLLGEKSLLHMQQPISWNSKARDHLQQNPSSEPITKHSNPVSSSITQLPTPVLALSPAYLSCSQSTYSFKQNV
jgi:hypothetical protein